MKRRSWPRGRFGSGQLGPVEHDGRGVIAGSEPTDTRKAYCSHTGADYWPRPCDACIARSEAKDGAA